MHIFVNEFNHGSVQHNLHGFLYDLACVRRGRYFANFVKSFRTGRSESTKREISRNNVESLERVPGVFSKMAASVNDAVLLKYCMFERNNCYY